MLSVLAALPNLSGPLLRTSAQAQAVQGGLLPSWNEGSAKQAIFDFVRATIDRSSPYYVFPEDRIATFDQDGTLWVEHPMYTQVVYCLDRVPTVVAQKPQLKNVEPFKTVLSGNQEAIARLSMRDLEKILDVTLSGMTVDDFKAEASKWLETAKHPRWNRLYTDLIESSCATASLTRIVAKSRHHYRPSLYQLKVVQICHGAALDHETKFGSGVCSLSGSTITKRVRFSWSKSERASITSLGGAPAIASRIRSAITVDSWSARSKSLWSEPSVIRRPECNRCFHKKTRLARGERLFWRLSDIPLPGKPGILYPRI
jgi:hypothetical protein